MRARIADIRAASSAAPLPLSVPVAPAAEPIALPLPPSDMDRAFDLIGEIAALLPAVVSRCERLDAAIAAARQQTRDDVAKVADVAMQWQLVAQGLKAQTEQLTRDTADFRRSAELAEAEAESLIVRGEQARRATEQANARAALYQQTILDSFGALSSGHSVLLGTDLAMTPQD